MSIHRDLLRLAVGAVCIGMFLHSNAGQLRGSEAEALAHVLAQQSGKPGHLRAAALVATEAREAANRGDEEEVRSYIRSLQAMSLQHRRDPAVAVEYASALMAEISLCASRRNRRSVGRSLRTLERLHKHFPGSLELRRAFVAAAEVADSVFPNSRIERAAPVATKAISSTGGPALPSRFGHASARAEAPSVLSALGAKTLSGAKLAVGVVDEAHAHAKLFQAALERGDRRSADRSLRRLAALARRHQNSPLVVHTHAGALAFAANGAVLRSDRRGLERILRALGRHSNALPRDETLGLFYGRALASALVIACRGRDRRAAHRHKRAIRSLMERFPRNGEIHQIVRTAAKVLMKDKRPRRRFR